MCIPKYSCHHLVSRGLHFELWPRRPRPYTLATLSFILWTQVSSIVTRHERESSSFDLNHFNNALYIDALVAICTSLRHFGTQWAVSLCIPKRSCKVVETLPCEMCNAFAISSTLIRLSEYTRSRTLLHISSSVAFDGRPDLVSSSKDVLLRLNSPTQNLTCAYDGAEDP